MAAYGTWSPQTGYSPLASPSTPPGIAPPLYAPHSAPPPLYNPLNSPSTPPGIAPGLLYPSAALSRPTVHPATQPGGMSDLMKLYQQALAGIETPAAAEARVNREIDAQIAAQQKLLLATNASERADALAAMQAQSQAGEAAAAMSKGLIGAVGGEYNAAAQEISGLAGGLTGAFNKTTSGEIKAANKALGNLGAPGVQVGGVGGIGGGLQAGVENYRGGTIPSQLFTETGDAATFGLAGQTAAQNLRATQEAIGAYQSTVHEINTAEQKAALALAAQRPELYHQYIQDANDARTKAITLATGLLTANQASTTAPTTRQFGNTYAQWDPTTRRWVPIARKPVTPRSTRLQTFRGSDGRTYVLHPNGVATLAPGQAGPKQPAQKNLTYKTLLGPDGKTHLYGVNGATGARVVDLGVTGAAKTPAGAKRPSATTVAKAGDLIKQWYYGSRTVQPVKGTKGQPRLMPAYKAPGFDANDPATYGKSGYLQYPAALANLTRMGFDRTTARNMLNEVGWERGDQGRPIFSSEEQAAMRQKFGSTPYERMVVTIRQALDSKQYDAARKMMGMMLSGQAFQSASSALANLPR